jgi:hypothetical protein
MTHSYANFESNSEQKKRRGNPAWQKGMRSPNAGGRPGALGDLREAARGYSTEALETLATVMRDPEAGHSARVAAARELLDRGYGRAVQAIDVGVQVNVAETHAAVLMRLTEAAREAKTIELKAQ